MVTSRAPVIPVLMDLTSRRPVPVDREQRPTQHRPVLRVELVTERGDELLGRAFRVLVTPGRHGGAGPVRVFGAVLAEPHGLPSRSARIFSGSLLISSQPGTLAVSSCRVTWILRSPTSTNLCRGNVFRSASTWARMSGCGAVPGSLPDCIAAYLRSFFPVVPLHVNARWAIGKQNGDRYEMALWPTLWPKC